MLKFLEVAKVFDKLEGKSGRLEMTDILAGLFKKAKSDEIDKLVYLMQGILTPPYEGTDLGMGEKFAIRALDSVTGFSKKEINSSYNKTGDLGETAEELLSKKKQQSLGKKEMNVSDVYDSLLKMAKISGEGSQDSKIKRLAELLNNSSPVEARFIMRFVTGKLRLGVGDPTILDALSVAKKGNKSLREPLERAFNISSDMGHVAKVFYKSPSKIKRFKVEPFKPLMPAMAERLANPEEIIKKIGKCAIEMKFDGFRLQCHKKGKEVELYSRKLERMTHMFPDVVDEIKKLRAKSLIFEGEALAFDEKKKKYYSFQETMRRRRKHGIKAAKEEFPLKVFCFDALYLNGKDLTEKPYEKRRKSLEKVFPKGILQLSEKHVVETPKDLDKLFKESLKEGLEGVMAKDLDAVYTAGKRKFAWIKLKKSYGKAVDTIDAVIVGYYRGKGHRAEFEFGGLLVAVLNKSKNRLETVAKIGSGFTEDEMTELKKMLGKMETKKPPENLEHRIKADFWVTPKYVVEVAFDEITKSPTHTCCLKEGKGYALRFPRLLSIRDDKSVKDATTDKEVLHMYKEQYGR